MVEQAVQSPSFELFKTWPHAPKQCGLSLESALLRAGGWAGDFLRSLPAWISVWSSDPKVQPAHNQGSSLFSPCLSVPQLFIWLRFYLRFGETKDYFQLPNKSAIVSLWDCKGWWRLSEDERRVDSNCCSWDRHKQWEPEARGLLRKAWAGILILETHIVLKAIESIENWDEDVAIIEDFLEK